MVNCTDYALVKAQLGKRTGQAGYSANLDVNKDGVINSVDLAMVSRAMPSGTTCSN